MDLAVYMIAATFVVFATVAAVMLAWSFSAGQWADLDHAARIVLADDDPYPGEPRAHRDGV
jgi:cbb3-type cytochrome oxidase maturation protein